MDARTIHAWEIVRHRRSLVDPIDRRLRPGAHVGRVVRVSRSHRSTLIFFAFFLYRDFSVFLLYRDCQGVD